MVEWEKQKKKDLSPRKIMKKTHLEPSLIHLIEVLRDKNGDCKAVILSALTKVKNKQRFETLHKMTCSLLSLLLGVFFHLY